VNLPAPALALDVHHEPTAQRFVAKAPGGGECVCLYRRQGDVLALVHTEVPGALQGQGLAGQVVQAAVQWARDEGLRVTPACSYVAAWLRRHPALPVPTAAAEVIGFWFGPPPLAARPEWFRKDAAFDASIRTRFGGLIEQALAGQLVHWADEPQGALARILLLDQFTRNIFRDTPRAFAGDAQALAAAAALVDAGADQALQPLQRLFVYLPFEHAEDIGAQQRAVALCEALASADPAFESFADYARRHHDVIARFGRFPHRNSILGRASTAEEEAFLQRPGSRF
jgi:uncharacterized protein (DUF924 family)